MTERFSLFFLGQIREELAAAQSMLLSKEAIITGLTKELAATRARMSDMRGGCSVLRGLQRPIPPLSRHKAGGY